MGDDDQNGMSKMTVLGFTVICNMGNGNGAFFLIVLHRRSCGCFVLCNDGSFSYLNFGVLPVFEFT